MDLRLQSSYYSGDTHLKRICILMCDFTLKHGVNRVIADLADSFKDRVLLCVARHDPSAAFKIPDSTEVVALKHWKCHPYPSFFFFGLGLWRFSAARMLAKEEGDLILCTHTTADIVHASAIKLFLPNKNVRISAFVYDKFELIPSDGRTRRYNADLLMTRGVVTLLIKFGLVDELFTIDSDMLQFVRDVLHTDKVHTVRIGVSHSLLSLSEQQNLTGTERIRRLMKAHYFKIFYQGILIPERRVEDLLLALHALIEDGRTTAHVFIGGALVRWFGSTYPDTIRAMAYELHLSDHVHFLGELTEEELAYMYRNCDAFVWTGDDQSWGLAPLEAMLFGKPIIISAGNGVSEVLNERIAMVVPPHNPQAIHRALETLMRDATFGEALGERAQHFVKENFMFANTANELARLWQLDA